MSLLQKYDGLLDNSFGKLSYSLKFDDSVLKSSTCQTNKLNESLLPPFIKKSSKISNKTDPIYLKDTDDSLDHSKSFDGMCSVHWGKKSQYKVKKGAKYIQVCKKCAVKFASRGIKTQPINSSVISLQKLQDDTKDKFIQKYVKSMELDWIITKMKLLEISLKDKKKNMKKIIQAYQKNKKIVQTFYQVLREFLKNTQENTQKQLLKKQQKNQNWKMTTTQSIIIIQKVIKDLKRKILLLSFEKRDKQSENQNYLFYKSSFIFHQHQCNQLDEQTNQLNVNKDTEEYEKISKFLSNKENILQKVLFELKSKNKL